MKILTVIGARPQFIKAALISRAIEMDCKPGIREILVHTGQHYDYNMSGKFLSELSIPKPKYYLNIGPSSRLKQLSKIICRLDRVIRRESPDMVMVYGDTTSTVAGALAANYLNIPVIHVEAGLRSFDKSIPEEINRVLTDNVSYILLCSTGTAVDNLKKENIAVKIFNVGDIMYELALETGRLAAQKRCVVDKLGLEPKAYILATVHRQSNTDDRKTLKNIADAFCMAGRTIVMPTHPRTLKMLKEFGLLKKIAQCKNIKLINPVGYRDMVCLEMNAEKIVTDSGGVQKEAYFHKVPCITLRENTEWVETLRYGWNRLVISKTENIIAAIKSDIRPSKRMAYYGNGNTTRKIIKILKNEVNRA